MNEWMNETTQNKIYLFKFNKETDATRKVERALGMAGHNEINWGRWGLDASTPSAYKEILLILF